MSDAFRAVCPFLGLPSAWTSLLPPAWWNLALECAFAAALAISAGHRLIAFLHARALQQHAYEDAPATHAAKTGTPTMGGLLFLAGPIAAWFAWRDDYVLALTVLAAACMAIGFADDYRGVRFGRNRGMRAREKFTWTGVAAAVFLLLALCALERRQGVPAADLRPVMWLWPHLAIAVPVGWWLAVSVVAVLGAAHAVNLTDGLDGLAAGTIVPPLAIFAWIAWRTATYGVAFVDVATIGALLGFLYYNRHPAKLFMGDTGSLALGGILAGSAILTGTQVLLILIGGVFVAETLSVILQVTSFKLTGKRIFRMSPLHHHFELSGWSETKVTRRFWAASALCSLLGAVLVR